MSILDDRPYPCSTYWDEHTANAKRADDWFLLWHLKAEMYKIPHAPAYIFQPHYVACYAEAQERGILPDWGAYSREFATLPV